MKKPRVLQVKLDISINFSALWRRIITRANKIARVLTLGPPYHTFIEVHEVRDFWHSDSSSKAPRNRCIWCNREERWWRVYERCNFEVTDTRRRGPFAANNVEVEETSQVRR